MRSFLTPRAALAPAGIHPVLWDFTDECNGLFARLIGYMGALALITIAVVSLWDQLPLRRSDPAAKSTWSVAARAYPAFTVSQSDLNGKTETYEILRNPGGGRKDVFRWGAQGEPAVTELEVYRPGGELGQSGPPIADIAARMDPDGVRELQAAGLIDSKFGAVTLLGLNGPGDARPCLGFIKRFEQPNLQISGWSCQGDTVPARRAAIGCILNRLILLTAGNDPKLAELFARAELRRADCAPGYAAAVISPDWVTGAQDPRLRGGL